MEDITLSLDDVKLLLDIAMNSQGGSDEDFEKRQTLVSRIEEDIQIQLKRQNEANPV